MLPVSSGRGATTCSFYLPGDREIIYASTDLGGAACPPKPDHSQGYVWALYPDYDIYRANADGARAAADHDTGLRCRSDRVRQGRLHVFTSTRDGDLELYRMDADGKNVTRLTQTVTTAVRFSTRTAARSCGAHRGPSRVRSR